MRRTIGWAIFYTVSTIAGSADAQAGPSPSVIAQAEATAAMLESAADTACPDEAAKIRQHAGTLHRFIREGSLDMAQVEITALTALANICKAERDNCGRGPAQIGMTKAEALHTSWCFPDKVNKTETAGHIQEQWVYQSGSHPNRGYLYFDNDRLTAIQATQ